ncbi:ankyrin repeat domain-containing protein [Sphingomonas sp. DG1-23]|uniref:ankyrin repeat domain-containing protein n=1 Tax=Sphingomonas sp. DG1-23 TaxID=3068316 RepID=UPI00274015D0|nr:ankyrin repeat domain-containing protein [Sphingomonas sp. DG1-23]MDP5279639.1 ankyrin repeat domain-containing protein [Sphingomonas sp. DG1-23]
MHRFRLLSPALALMTMGCESDARADCFVQGTELPTRRDTLTDQRLGAAARDFAEALFDGNIERAGQLLRGDPGLARRRVGTHYDMLSVALATCRADSVDLVVRGGAPLDGVDDKGLPLRLALRAKDPEFAHRLLTAGASPNPAGSPSGPLRTAITLNSLGAVRMLLDFRADPNVMEATGNRPLHTALDMEHFRIAELLLDRGADAWAIDGGGANLGTAATTKMLTDSAEEGEAQRRLAERLKKLGWPEPVPSFRDVRAAAASGNWPPAAARAAGAAPVPPAVLALIKANMKTTR